MRTLRPTRSGALPGPSDAEPVGEGDADPVGLTERAPGLLRADVPPGHERIGGQSRERLAQRRRGARRPTHHGQQRVGGRGLGRPGRRSRPGRRRPGPGSSGPSSRLTAAIVPPRSAASVSPADLLSLACQRGLNANRIARQSLPGYGSDRPVAVGRVLGNRLATSPERRLMQQRVFVRSA